MNCLPCESLDFYKIEFCLVSPFSPSHALKITYDSTVDWRRKWQPTAWRMFLPGESQGCGVAQSQTRLKQLSSSSSNSGCDRPSG